MKVSDLSRGRKLLFAAIGLTAIWFVFVGSKLLRHRLLMRAIATELFMEYRTFHVLPDPFEPSTAVPGEERMLVVGESSDDFLVCSIVRNPLYDDWRSQWKVDNCYRPELNPGSPRTAIWRPFKQYPTDADLRLFRKEALEQPWVTWDCPEGTDPKVDVNKKPSGQLAKESLR